MINFETKSGNEYFYCSESGVIYPKKVYNRRFNAIKEFEKNSIDERKKRELLKCFLDLILRHEWY